ncbi:hypothetical protein MSG28_010779 [Choristoneura fumiferana]|uniref:Uncharacterized protein n=1 Tax=Choristoneura fumiferana TaxID=7141 RepID=A0ACC0KPF2_CHOFU|nr:hypothetical protein MSG28_010779 [Choristoneura fumiferana]
MSSYCEILVLTAGMAVMSAQGYGRNIRDSMKGKQKLYLSACNVFHSSLLLVKPRRSKSSHHLLLGASAPVTAWKPISDKCSPVIQMHTADVIVSAQQNSSAVNGIECSLDDISSTVIKKVCRDCRDGVCCIEIIYSYFNKKIVRKQLTRCVYVHIRAYAAESPPPALGAFGSRFDRE